ncbi:MAG TPA: lysylphosphatidylglycerol synthase transmembrane domain-containing protein [Opitutaceae bacterium]
MPAPARRGRSSAILAAKIIVSAAFVALVLQKVSLHEVVDSFRRLRPGPMAAALALCAGISPFLFAWRWDLLSSHSIGFPRAIKYTWIGFLFAAILPGFISGDVAKGVSMAIRRRSSRNIDLPVSIFLDRLVGLFALLLFFAASCAYLAIGSEGQPLSASGHLAALIGLGIASICLGFCIFGLTPAGNRTLSRALRALVTRIPGKATALPFIEQAMGTLRRRGLIARALCIGIVLQVLMSVQTLLMLDALSQHVSLFGAVLIQTIASIAAMVPVSVAGIGVRDCFTVALFPAIGLTTASAIAYSWLCVACALVLALVGGVAQMHEIFTRRQ